MTFADFYICHRMASLRKLYSLTLTYIFDIKYLKYVKFVHFRMLPEAKIILKNQQHTFLKHMQSNGIRTIFLLLIFIFKVKSLKYK